MSKQSKACEFPPKVRKLIKIRDQNKCVYCHSKNGIQIAHVFVPRSKGGLGVKENGACLCVSCHMKLDNGLDKEAIPIDEYVKGYMRRLYDINIKELIYNKWEVTNERTI